MPSTPDDRVGFSLQIVRLTMVGVKVTDVRHVSMSTRLGNSGVQSLSQVNTLANKSLKICAFSLQSSVMLTSDSALLRTR